MRVFFSVGEPSGDVHGANLIRSLQELRPGVECVGFGGERMAQAGCKHLFPLTQLAVMGFSRVFAMLPQFMSLLSQADRYFQHHRPDAVVLIDFPGFNWWIARRAHFHGIPVFFFVPPQLWAWATWRVEKMRRYVDHALCSLPFEESWYRERGVQAEYVGHPFFDDLPQQKLDSAFLESQRARGGVIIGLLPGSRRHEVEMNFKTQLRAASAIHRERPETRFLVASFKSEHQKMAEQMLRKFPHLPVQVVVKKTPEVIELSKACIAVSGSVSLELLYRVKPTVIVFRHSRMLQTLLRPFFEAKYITLVNLLADKVLFPEFRSVNCEAGNVAPQVLRWLNHDQEYAGLCRELLALREKVAQPGACLRTARRIVDVIGERRTRAA